MRKWIGFVLGAIVVLAAVITGIGYALPQDHVATVQRSIPLPPAEVFAKISDVSRFPEWRTDTQEVTIVSRSPLTWRERAGGDVITYEVVESRPPERLVVRIADPDLPFGGTWTYELQPEGAGTRVTITEHGQVFNPIFRFMSRFVFGHVATMNAVLDALTPVASL